MCILWFFTACAIAARPLWVNIAIFFYSFSIPLFPLSSFFLKKIIFFSQKKSFENRREMHSNTKNLQS
jgi:hypothetical protein